MNTTKSVLRTLASLAVVLATTSGVDAQEKDNTMEQQVFYRTVTVDGLSIFYREAGRKDAPTILLLHGLPSSSRMFQPLLTRLADSYHLVAPDYPGFGHSDWPDPKQFRLHLRPHRFRDGRIHASVGFVALHTLHAGLRRAGWLSHGIGTSGAGAGSDRPGCGRSQRRPWGELGNPAGILGGPPCSRRGVAQKPAFAGNHEDAPYRRRSED